jgi:hypothetical protein
VYLLHWPSELELAASACSLLGSLARLRAPQRRPAAVLAALPGWAKLTEIARDRITTIPHSSQRTLAEALCRVAAATPDDAAREAALRGLCTPLAQKLGGISSAAAAAADASHLLCRPDAALEVRSLCNALRGLALGSCRASASVVFECLGTVLPQLLALLPSYVGTPDTLIPLLKVHRDLAASAALLLPHAQALLLAEHCSKVGFSGPTFPVPSLYLPRTFPVPSLCSKLTADFVGRTAASFAAAEAAAAKAAGTAAAGAGGGNGAGPSAEAELEETFRYVEITVYL